MKKYEINKNTLAIIAITNGISKVYEKDKTLYVYSPTIKIILVDLRVLKIFLMFLINLLL